jgi:hypothetical protein
MTKLTIPWPIRSTLAGTAGTATMTAAYATERRLRHDHRGPLDYDDSLVPGKIVASIMHLGKVTDREDNEIGLALRWSYGSVFGLWHGILRRRFSEPLASVLFGATLMSATFSMFPLLGRTPPPWRWPADVMATAIGTHVAYVAGVAVVDDALARLAT